MTHDDIEALTRAILSAGVTHDEMFAISDALCAISEQLGRIAEALEETRTGDFTLESLGLPDE